MTAASRRFQEPAPGPVNDRDNGSSNLSAGRGGGGTPRQRRIPANEAPYPNPNPIQRLCLMPDENTFRMCQNISLSILGGAAFCKLYHAGFTRFTEFPRKGFHVHPLTSLIDKEAVAMATVRGPVPASHGTGIT